MEERVRLVQTCGACPEQYDVFHPDGRRIGYLRLRHGTFRADYPDCGSRTVYTAHPEGDGIFQAHERERFLTEAVDALLKADREARTPHSGRNYYIENFHDYLEPTDEEE